MSLDGFAAGPDQSLDAPVGVGGERLHAWIFETRFGRSMIGADGGTTGVDDDWLARARDAVGGLDVRIGGGVSTVAEAIRRGLVDEVHLAVVPVLLHDGEHLHQNLGSWPDGYRRTEGAAGEGALHLRFERAT